ncbi:MAG TPA: DUF4386 domain-containing protein [Anaerolineales bacterium]|nr:DUF4386 domain-containing protein [Anaerolineales bacterium]
MTSNISLRRTAILVASLWIVTAIGAIVGNALLNPVVNAPDYLTTVFPQSATVISGMLLWLINDIGIVFIGLLMFPILRKHSESMALGYVSMRMFESIFLIIGVIFAMMLIPLSQAFIKAGAADITSFQAIGSVLKQAQHWFMDTMQLIPLGLGGVILTTLLYKSKLVPRFFAVFGFIGYGLLLPCALLTLFGVQNIAPGVPVASMVIPVAIWEIILMPIWLYAKGFNMSAIAAKPANMETNELLSPA